MRKKLEKIYMALIFILLYAPIVTLVVLSFNASKTRAKWGGFTLHWYRSLFANTEIMNALYTTLIIALLASAIATILGTLACIGINSMSKKSRTLFMGITNIPMLNGEIVMGISLMLLFIICRIQLGFGTILMAHITFNVPYVILSVMPKLKQTNKSTYEAALDLGASPLYAFWKVIFPDIMPGVVSGFLLSFTMSLDDFVITYFTKGPGVDTLSTKIYAEVRKGIKPEMYSLSTILFVTVLLLLLLVNVNPSPKEEKEEAKEREAMAKKGIRFRITKRVVFRRILPIAMVLVIGGGDGGCVRELCRYQHIEHIDLVEIDERVVAVCKEYLPGVACSLDDPRVHILYQDGLKYIRRIEDEYDLIIIDSTDPFGPGEGLFTMEFYGNCYKALKEHGVLVNQHESPFYKGDALACQRAHRNIVHSFELSRLFQAHIPTYPSGHWLFGFSSRGVHPVRDLNPDWWNSLGLETRYYNTNLHKGAFYLPNYVQKLLEKVEE